MENNYKPKYFTIEELCKSTTAQAKGIDNTPSETIKEHLLILIEKLLDPVREMWSKPLKVNSGYRCPELNTAVKGSKSSDHQLGFAADLNAGSKEDNEKLFGMIKDNFTFDQLIDEKDFTWVHVSYNPNRLRKQVLKL